MHRRTSQNPFADQGPKRGRPAQQRMQQTTRQELKYRVYTTPRKTYKRHNWRLRKVKDMHDILRIKAPNRADLRRRNTADCSNSHAQCKTICGSRPKWGRPAQTVTDSKMTGRQLADPLCSNDPPQAVGSFTVHSQTFWPEGQREQTHMHRRTL
jgi:hypothetical protein